MRVLREKNHELTRSQQMPGVRCVVEKLNVSFGHEIAIGLHASCSRLPSEFLFAGNQELDIDVATVGLQSGSGSCFPSALHVHRMNQVTFDGNALIDPWSGWLIVQEMEGLCESGVDAEILFTVV